MTEGAVSIAAIRAAREAIGAAIRLTPTWPSVTLEQLTGVPVRLKCEQLQITGSFKIRGATNFVRQLRPEDAVRGLIAASAGNHAQGVAYAAAARGISVSVVMPVFAPLAKVNAAEGYGARVILKGGSLEEARTEALAIASAEGRLYVPPFDDDTIIAGQGTLGLELLEQEPDAAEVLVPAGGGGLLGGVALALKESNPAIRVIGIQSAAMDGIVRSRLAGKPVTAPPLRTIADGVAVAGPSARTFAVVERYVDDVVTVPDEAIARAIVLLIEKSKFIVEGAGALAVAALQSGAYRPRGKTVAVLSGGNIDINLLGSIVRRGLVEAGRYQHLTVEVADTPGELAMVLQVIAAAGGNVVEVGHNRESPTVPIGVAVVDLLLEVNGPVHMDLVVRALREHDLQHVEGSPARLATDSARRRHET